MSAEAEKVISLSLCKMAETRTTRRGGTSLHKHLLIASVLTKATRARSAFLDTWYMRDENDDSADGAVDLNMSYQEADFPTDELDSTIGDNPELDIDPSLVEHVTGIATEEIHSAFMTSTLNATCDVSEVESEIDLPPDILSCVEKLGDINDRIFSSTQQSASSSISPASNIQSSKGINCQLYVPLSISAIPDVISNQQQIISPVPSSEDIQEDSQLSSTLTYLDLDAGSSTVVERRPLVTSTPIKRRREWCFDDDEDDEIELCDSRSVCIETPVKSPPKAKRISKFSKNCKRLRYDDDSGICSPEKTDDETEVPSPRATDDDCFKISNFRLTYENDADDSDDDSFLDDALSQGHETPSQIQMIKLRQRNDRRVPSTSSSGSGSDEDGDGESSMEVDQITNLVQFISFNKQQQNQAQNAANLRSISCVN